MSGRTFIRFLNSFLHTGTPSSSTFLRGDGAWAESISGFSQQQQNRLNALAGDFISPTTLNVATGGTPVGSVTDVQTLLDGNVYQVPEVTGVPGYDIEFNFTGVASIAGFVSMIRYTGSATHVVSLRLQNYTDVQEDSFLVIPTTVTNYGYRTVLIPDDTKYIDGSGNAQMVLYHDSSGNASHDVYIDYIALIGTST